MPVIGQEIIKRVDLITDGAWVEILTNPKGGAFEGLDMESGDVELIGGAMLERIIKKWNFTEADGSDVPITSDNIKRALSDFDSACISRALGLDKLAVSDKKKDSSSSTSTPKSEVNPPSTTQS